MAPYGQKFDLLTASHVSGLTLSFCFTSGEQLFLLTDLFFRTNPIKVKKKTTNKSCYLTS
jgi:hypothetical protein